MSGMWTLLPAIGMYVVAMCMVIAAAMTVADRWRR